MIPNIEQTAMRKVYLRLLPFSVLCMFVCYLDRVNVGFAALTMNKDLGLSAYFFGLGAGAFYGGYCLFEVPSNLVLERVGARFWIARIMITWGLLSGAMALVSGPVSFVTLRFLLGAAEAGFFPGILFYFHYWFPMRHRGRMISWFTVATPISVALGGPISTGILGLDGTLGLAGWQWVFIAEAIPAVILGFVVLIYLRDRPAHASWLTQAEKEWLAAELAQERREIESVRTYTLFQSLTNIRVLALAIIYFGIVTASVGLVIFVPQIIKELGVSNLATGFLTAIPYIVGTADQLRRQCRRLYGTFCGRLDQGQHGKLQQRSLRARRLHGAGGRGYRGGRAGAAPPPGTRRAPGEPGGIAERRVSLPFPCQAFDHRRARLPRCWTSRLFPPGTAPRKIFSRVFPVRQGNAIAPFPALLGGRGLESSAGD
jgi:MFS family permease